MGAMADSSKTNTTSIDNKNHNDGSLDGSLSSSTAMSLWRRKRSEKKVKVKRETLYIPSWELELGRHAGAGESHRFVLSGLIPKKKGVSSWFHRGRHVEDGTRTKEQRMSSSVKKQKAGGKTYTLGLWSWWRDVYVKGFTRTHVVTGLQVFVGFVVFLAIVSPDAVYDALSYNGTVAPTWGLIYSLMLCITGGTVGMNTLQQIYVEVSLVFAGCLGLLIRHLTYLAAGEDWNNNDVAKGATYSILISLTCGCFNVLRWKWDVLNPFFFMCSIFLIFTQGKYSGEGSGTLYLTPVYTLINLSIATMLYTLISWVLFPIYSSTTMRRSIASAFQSMGNAILAEKDLMLGPIDVESGLLQDATGKVDMVTGRDEGLYDQCQNIANHVMSARASILGNRSLRVPCLLEVDVYRTHNTWDFPVVSFMHVDYYSHILLSIITNLSRPLKMGMTNMRMLQSEEMKSSLRRLFRSFVDVLDAMAHFIADEKDSKTRITWKEVDDMVELCHTGWIEFLRVGQRAISESKNADERFGVRIVSIFLYNLGSRMRELYLAVAIAVSSEDESALDLAFARYESRPSWLLSRVAYEHLDMDPLDIIHSDESMKVVAAVHDKEWFERTKKSIKAAQGDRELAAVLASEFGLTLKSGNARPRDAFKIPLWFIMGFQYFLTVLIAIALGCIPVVQDKVFNGRGTDVLFTVVVLWQPNIGSLTSRAFNRMLGTGMAAVWSYVLISITYGATGLTWANTAQKWIVSGFLASLWGAFSAMNGARYRLYSYMWFVAGFTVSLVTLSLLREPSPPWKDAAVRFLNVIYGIVISWAVCIMLFPISAWRMVRDNYANSCSALADALTVFPSIFEPIDTPTHPCDYASTSGISPLLTLFHKEINSSALYMPFKEKNLANVLNFTNRARRILAATSGFVGPAEKETFYFRKPKKIPSGRITKSLHGQNIFIDYMYQIICLKMEFFPQSRWKISKPLYDALKSFYQETAKTMHLLDVSVHKQGKQIDVVLDALKRSSKEAENLIILSREAMKAFEKLSAESQDEVAPMQNAEMLLVYTTLSIYLQTKSLVAAAAQSFMFTDPDSLAKVDNAIKESDFLEGIHHGPEAIISEFMELGRIYNRAPPSSTEEVQQQPPSRASSLAVDMALELKKYLDSMSTGSDV